MRGAPPPGTRPVLKASVRLHWTGPAQQIASAAGPAQRWLVFNTGWPAGSSTHAASLQGGFGGCHLLPLRLSAAAAGWLRCGTVVLWLQQSAPAQASMEGGIALGRPGGRCPTRCRARPGDWRCHGCRRQRAPAALPAALPSAASHQSRRLPAVQRRHCVPCRHTLGCTRAQPPAVGVYSCCRLPGRSGSKGPCCRACPARRARTCRLAQVALHACSQLWLHVVNRACVGSHGRGLAERAGLAAAASPAAGRARATGATMRAGGGAVLACGAGLGSAAPLRPLPTAGCLNIQQAAPP